MVEKGTKTTQQQKPTANIYGEHKLIEHSRLCTEGLPLEKGDIGQSSAKRTKALTCRGLRTSWTKTSGPSSLACAPKGGKAVTRVRSMTNINVGTVALQSSAWSVSPSERHPEVIPLRARMAASTASTVSSERQHVHIHEKTERLFMAPLSGTCRPTVDRSLKFCLQVTEVCMS